MLFVCSPGRVWIIPWYLFLMASRPTSGTRGETKKKTAGPGASPRSDRSEICTKKLVVLEVSCDPTLPPDTRYPLVMTYKKLLKMAIDIVDFSIKNGGSFHSYVSLPEGTPVWKRSLEIWKNPP